MSWKRILSDINFKIIIESSDSNVDFDDELDANSKMNCKYRIELFPYNQRFG